MLVNVANGTVDIERRVLLRPGLDPVPMRLREVQVLGYLAARPGQAVSRATLLTEVFEFHPSAQTRALDATVRRLRKAIEAPGAERVVQTVHGVGYRYLGPPQPVPASTPAQQAALRDCLSSHRFVTVVGGTPSDRRRLVQHALAANPRAVWCNLSSSSDVLHTVQVALGAADVYARRIEDPPEVLVLEATDAVDDILSDLIPRWLGQHSTLSVVCLGSKALLAKREFVFRLEMASARPASSVGGRAGEVLGGIPGPIGAAGLTALTGEPLESVQAQLWALVESGQVQELPGDPAGYIASERSLQIPIVTRWIRQLVDQIQRHPFSPSRHPRDATLQAAYPLAVAHDPENASLLLHALARHHWPHRAIPAPIQALIRSATPTDPLGTLVRHWIQAAPIDVAWPQGFSSLPLQMDAWLSVGFQVQDTAAEHAIRALPLTLPEARLQQSLFLILLAERKGRLDMAALERDEARDLARHAACAVVRHDLWRASFRISQRLGRPQSAARDVAQQLALAEHLATSRQAESTFDEAHLYFDQGRFSQCEEALAAALVALGEEDPATRAQALILHAEVEQLKLDDKRAETALEEARHLASLLGGRVYTLALRGSLDFYRRQGDLDRVARLAGRLERAGEGCADSVCLARLQGQEALTGLDLAQLSSSTLGFVALHGQDLEQARTQFLEAARDTHAPWPTRARSQMAVDALDGRVSQLPESWPPALILEHGLWQAFARRDRPGVQAVAKGLHQGGASEASELGWLASILGRGVLKE